MQHVVEVRDIRQTDTSVFQGRVDSARSRLIKWLSKIERVRYGIEHRFRRNVGLRGMQSRRKLDAIHRKLARKIQPFFDSAVRILVAQISWSQFLKCRCEHPN